MLQNFKQRLLLLHRRAQFFFGFSTPVAAVEADEYRGVRQRQVGFNDHDLKGLACIGDVLVSLRILIAD